MRDTSLRNGVVDRRLDGLLTNEIVESLRAMRKAEPLSDPILLSAADPLNLIGILVPGDRVPSVSSRHIMFTDGATINFEEVDINKLPARVVSRGRYGELPDVSS